MSAALETVVALLPKLKSAERRALRTLLDASEVEAWRKRTAQFRRALRGKARDRRPASEVLSELRR